MNAPHILFPALVLLLFAFNANSEESIYEAKLNTANTIRAAFELRRLSESLALGVDTRCYIASLAKFQADSLLQIANTIANPSSDSEESDTFAIQSAKKSMEVYRNNKIEAIADKCKGS